MKWFKRIIKNIKNVVRNVFDSMYHINIYSNKIFHGITVEIDNRFDEPIQITLLDSFRKGMNNFDIMQAMRDLEEMDYRYFHIREYNDGLFVYLSNDGIPGYSKNKRYRDITIPVRSNMEEINLLLENLLLAREFYDMHGMEDIELDVDIQSEMNITIGSSAAELNITTECLDSIINRDMIKFDNCEYYAITSDEHRFGIMPLDDMNIEDWQENGIMMTRDQIIKEILSVVDFVNYSYLHKEIRAA